ncbi:MAG: RND transporter [Nitrospiraceae bacterium]|nr:MAG: RND transporter [Nitrospiraceae bacterium]
MAGKTVKKSILATAVWAASLAAGCDSTPNEATGAKPTGRPAQSATEVRLDPETAARSGITVQPVARGEFRTFRDFPATIRPNERAVADITTLVRGRVVDVYADLGQEVKADDLLAILYSSELGLAQSAYLKAQAKLYLAEQSFKRAEFLLQEKVIGTAEAQRREAELYSARAEAREAKDRLLLLGMEEKEIKQLDRDQKIRSYVPIEAPFAGRIIARNVTRGEVVETTEKLFVVADLSEVWVVANIPEKDIPSIRPNGTAEVRVAAYPDDVFTAKITYVGDVLDPTTRTMSVRLELPNPQGRLKPEMFATVRIHSETEPGALLVPEAAVQRDRNRTFVFVQRDAQTFEAREVRLGPSNGQMVKILDGLREGEPVVIRGAFILKSELQKKDI